MNKQITANLTEYKRELEQHQRAIIALTGAIQALERLQTETEKETEDGDIPNSNKD